MSHADERADLWAVREQRARKDHQCTACWETIPRGACYRRIAVGGEGTVDTVKQCARCSAIFDAIGEQDPQAPILPNLDCGESWLDTFGETDVEALAFMLPTDDLSGWPS